MIYLASDHRGFQLKEAIKQFLAARSIAAEDRGAFAYDAGDDYVDFAAEAAAKITANPAEHRGIFICGSGQGMSIVANKFRGIRAALCWNTREAQQSRRDDDANILVLAADAYDEAQAQEIVAVWMDTPFSGEERHIRRLREIGDIEARNFK
jgi:ribose 5-phosphate isomerase B